MIFASVTTKVEAGAPQWPVGELTNLAIVSIDLRIILDRVSLEVVDWEYGAQSIEPLQPPGYRLAPTISPFIDRRI